MLEILHREAEKGELVGVIVQLGGQTPLKLAAELQAAGVPILGTSPDSIDLAEDRERFAKLVDKLGLQAARQRHRPQPRRGDRGGRRGSAIRCCCGRPTCSAGGRWRWSTGPTSSTIISPPRSQVSGDSPVLIDRYLRDAIEVDVDAICDGTDGRGRRHPPAYRGSRGPFGRQRLLDPALQPVRRGHRRDRAADRGAGAGAQGQGADEHPVRGQGRARSI